MIYLIVFRLCIGQTIKKTLYLQDNEYYQQGLYELFSDTIDHQYSFVDSTKGFYIRDSNLKQEQVGRYSINPTNIIAQKQLKNLEDYQGNNQYGILFKDDNDKHQLCYNSNIQNLAIDFCIQLDNNYYGYDFIFIDYNTVAISSIQNDIFQVLIYQGDIIISQFSFYPSIYYQSLKSTKIDMMVYDNQKCLLVVGIYPTDQKNIPIDVLIIQSNYTITLSPLSINFKNINGQEISQVIDIKTVKGYAFVKVGYDAKYIIFQIYYWVYKCGIVNSFQQQNNIGFDFGYSTIDGSSFRSIILAYDTEYQLQSIDNTTQIQSQYQKVIKQDSIFKFTKNYLIFLQDNQLIISNFKDNIQRINQITSQILSIDVDFQNDKLIVFTISEIIKYQLQDIYLAYQGQKTDNLDIVTITNGLKRVQIQFRVLDQSNKNLYQLANKVNYIYYNSIYSPGPFKIPVFVSGFDPKLQVFTESLLNLTAANYQILEAKCDNKIPVFQQVFVIDGFTSIFKLYENQNYVLKQCSQYSQILDCNKQIQEKYTYGSQVKPYTQQYGDIQRYLILLDNKIDIYNLDHYSIRIEDIENISDVVVTDKIFVVYKTFIKLYTYPNAIQIYKLDSSQLNIDNPIKIWANNLYNNYLFILSQKGQLVIGYFTNRFYLTQIIQFYTIKIDISIVANNKIILSQQNNNGLIDVSVYNLLEGQIVKQYPLDLHNYTIKHYILQKDYFNGLVGIQAQLNEQKVLLLYGFAQQQRDQLQKIIYLDWDYDTVSMCSNKDQTQILQTYKQKPNLKVFYVHHGHQYVYVQQSEYIPNKFSQGLPITYHYSSNYDNQNFTIYKQIFYEKDYTTVECRQQYIEIECFDDSHYAEYELPTNLFSGQVTKIEKTFYSEGILLKTRVKYNQDVKKFGYSSKCQQVTKYQRILCSNYQNLTYHKYNGDLIQQVAWPHYTLSELIINKDNSNAIGVAFKAPLYLINISQNSISVYQNEVDLLVNFSINTYYKNWFINYDNNRLQFYYVSQDENWNLSIKYQLYVANIIKFDYHPQSESIYYTQNNNILSVLQCSLESDSLTFGQIITFDIQDNLFKQYIFTEDLKLNYLKIFDNNIVISSNYGHIYTFDIDNLELLKIHLITGPSAYVQDIYIIEGYLILKGQSESELILYENRIGKNINQPYLSLESIKESYREFNLVALYKDDKNIVNILFSYREGYISNYIINDKFILWFSNLPSNPNPIYIYASNPYSNNYTRTQVIKKNRYRYLAYWISLGVLCVMLIVVILLCIWKKYTQPKENTLIMN